MYIGISVISTGCLLMFVSYTTAINYEPLIMPICKEYGTTTVSLFTGNCNLTYEKKVTLHRITKALSSNGISTDIISYKELKMAVELRNGSTTRSLIVIMIDTVNDFYDWRRLTRYSGLGYRIWLLIFNEFKPSLYCKAGTAPHSVTTNLRFGDKIIISCLDSNISHKFLSNEENFLRDFRYSMDRRELRVAVMPKLKPSPKSRRSLEDMVLEELSRAMNVSVSQLSIKNAVTLLDLLFRNEIDITANLYIIEHLRKDGLEAWTTPIVAVKPHLYFRKKPKNFPVWTTHFQVMTVSAWIVMTATILLTTLSLTAIKYVTRGGHLFPILYEEYSHTWGIYCGQGMAEFPKELPLRIVCITTLLSVFIMSNVYSSLVLSYLTTPSQPQFTTLEDFLDDGTHQFIQVTRKALLPSILNGPTRDKMLSLLKPEELWPRSHYEALEQVCTQKVVYYSTQNMVPKTILPCDIASIHLPGSNQAAFLISPTSGYRRLVNYYLHKLRTSGVLQRMIGETVSKTSREPSVFEVGFQQLAVPFTILGIGFLLTSIIFIIEIKWKKLRTIKSLPRIGQACMLSKSDCFRACKARYVTNCRE